MKLVNKVVTVVSSIAAIAMLASCGSTSGAADSSASGAAAPVPAQPEAPSEPPTFTFSGSELKIEVENMYTEEFLIFPDANASGGYAGKLVSEESVAKAFVTFPAGTYVGLVNEDAPDGNHDAFNAFVDGVAYRSYPSDPPIGTYELTTRSPMNFTIDAEKTVEVRIQQNDPNRPNKPGENGMKLDYIIFQKQ
ncbi:MAG: hypothetical protein K2J81_01725 [Treponemataceae bacterium]|nr:hypothetical protein [Treponemataceae bacterium]